MACFIAILFLLLVVLGGSWIALHFFLGDDQDPVDPDGLAMADGVVD
jgi:hypothetical protein